MGCRPSGLQGCRWWQRQGGASLSVPSDLKPKPESKEGGRNQHTDVRPLPGSPGARHTSNPRDQSPGGSCPPSARADPRGQPALGGSQHRAPGAHGSRLTVPVHQAPRKTARFPQGGGAFRGRWSLHSLGTAAVVHESFVHVWHSRTRVGARVSSKQLTQVATAVRRKHS